MRWSLRIARVGGIDITVHATFALILALAGWEWGRVHGAAGVAFGVLLMLALFACVTLHELGHAVAANALGVPVRRIVLLPIGGVALLERPPRRPLHELIIAAAGPAVTLAIAVVLAAVVGLTAPVQTLDRLGLVDGALPPPSAETLLVWLLAANVTLLLFNLIPAFPLDGGRMLRAGLAVLIGPLRATRIAAVIGRGAAVGLGVLGIVSGNILLALVAVFVFLAAGAETVQTQARSVLGTRRVGDAYNRHALALSPGDRLSRAVDHILTSYQPDFAVLLGNRLLGVVTREQVLAAIAVRPDDPYVAEIMQRDVVRVQAHETLDEVLETLRSSGQRVAAVDEGGRFLGLVSREDLEEALGVLLALERGRMLRRVA